MAIKYSDREVERFHPICQQSLQMALSLTGKADTYRIEHHKNAGGLEMDFAITNRNSGKVMCVVEVKRTPSAQELALPIPGHVIHTAAPAHTDRAPLLCHNQH